MSVVSGIWGAESSEDAAETQAHAADKAAKTEWRMYEQSREDLMPWMKMGTWALGGPEGYYIGDKYIGSDLESLDEDALRSEAEKKILPLFGGELPSKSSNRKLYNQMVDEEMSSIKSGLQPREGTGLAGMIAKGPGEFEKSPGYEFVRQEGEKGLRRGLAATGRSDSGAAMKALSRYNQDYASTEYDKFLARYYQSLTPYQSLAGIGQTTGTTSAALSSQTGTNIGNTYMAKGNAQASGYINQANAIQNMSSNTIAGLSVANDLGWLGGGGVGAASNAANAGVLNALAVM